MVKVGSASCGVEDSARVLLEDHFISFDQDGGWLLSNGGLHLGNVVGGDVLVGRNIDGSGFGC